VTFLGICAWGTGTFFEEIVRERGVWGSSFFFSLLGRKILLFSSSSTSFPG
jgi:hypothetical protein